MAVGGRPVVAVESGELVNAVERGRMERRNRETVHGVAERRIGCDAFT